MDEDDQEIGAGFHLVDLFEVDGVDEGGSPVSMLTDYVMAEVSSSAARTITNRPTFTTVCTRRARTVTDELPTYQMDESGHEVEVPDWVPIVPERVQLEDVLACKREDLVEDIARKARLEEAFDEKTVTPFLATRALLVKKGDRHQDPIERVEVRIRRLTQEIRALELKIKVMAAEAVNLNERAATVAPDAIALLKERFGTRRSARHVPNSSKN